MTDSEIVKALENCSSWKRGKCSKCRYNSIGRCVETMMTEAVDVITHQQAEIEKLKKGIREVNGCFFRMEGLYNIKCRELKFAKSDECENDGRVV